MPDFYFAYRKSSGEVTGHSIAQTSGIPAETATTGIAVDPNYGSGITPPGAPTLDPDGVKRLHMDSSLWNMPNPAHYDVGTDTLRAPTAGELATYAAAVAADELSDHQQKFRDAITTRGIPRVMLETLVRMEASRPAASRVTRTQIRDAWNAASGGET